ncbi:MAG: glycerate kinase [Candidatus Sulfobium sp.]
MDLLSPKETAEDIFYAALKSVDPYEAVKKYVDRIRRICEEAHFERLLIVGFGKAACTMAKAAEEGLERLIGDGVIITKYGHCKETLRKIKVFEAGHPVPDENGLRGTSHLTGLLQESGEDTLVVCLISGGGSALLVSPYDDIPFGDKQEITRLLLLAGADIFELNMVRKHLSAVKGGRLAELAWPSRVVSLILSDVIGDRLDVIASGPTSPDSTTFRDARDVLEKYDLMSSAPRSVVALFEKGAGGTVPDTPKEDNKAFGRVENIIIGSNRTALLAAARKSIAFGLKTEIVSSEIRGEARTVAKGLAERAKELKKGGPPGTPACLISGGETTVTVAGGGTGGRNMELALSFAMEIEGCDGITLLSAGTDGTDGPTDAAGAVVDGGTIARAAAAGLVAREFLENNDSYHFFEKAGGLFITGPTGTNVMDVQIILVK